MKYNILLSLIVLFTITTGRPVYSQNNANVKIPSHAQIVDLGTFNSVFSKSQISQTTGDKLYYRFELTQPSEVTIDNWHRQLSDQGYALGTILTLATESYEPDLSVIKSNKGSFNIKNTPNSDLAYINVILSPGVYYIINELDECRNITGSVEMTIRGISPVFNAVQVNYNSQEGRFVPIPVGIFNDAFEYSDARNTERYTPQSVMQGEERISYSNCVYYEFELQKPMRISIDHLNSTINNATRLFLYKVEDEGSYRYVDGYGLIQDSHLALLYSDKREWNFYGSDSPGDKAFLDIYYLPEGRYLIYSAGADIYSSYQGKYMTTNGIIVTNINGTSIQRDAEDKAVNIGAFKESFTNTTHGVFVGSGTKYNDVREKQYQIQLNTLMDISFSITASCGSLGTTLIDSNGRMANPDSNGAYNKLSPGLYTLVVLYGGVNDLPFTIELSGTPVPLEGDKKESAITVPVVEGYFAFDDIRNTVFYFDEYKKNSTNDVFYKIVLPYAMDITVSHCGSEVDNTYLTLTNENLSIIKESDNSGLDNFCTQKGQACLLFKKLAAGTYYIISEGKNTDGIINTFIEGYPVTANQISDTKEVALSTSKNYIYTIVPSESAEKIEDVKTTDRGRHSIAYFDALGRPEQSILWRNSPQKQDIISMQEYDSLGREDKSWLPIAYNGGGKIIDANRFKIRSRSIYKGDQLSYSKPVYEDSPLNRATEQYAPGEDWHNNHKSVKMRILTNVEGTDSLNCIRYVAEKDGQNATLIKNRNYASGELFVTSTMDEDGNISFEFKDKSGRVILIRQFNDTQTFDTYFVYDVFNNLSFVLPPRIDDEGISKVKLDELAYQYKYDHRNRCIWKKLPGCEPIYYVYDKADRLILTQDGEQRAKGEWLFSIPDAFGRIVLTGTCKNIVNFAAVNPINTVVKASQNLSNTTNKYYDIAGITLSTPSVLTASYYDNYNHRTKEDFAKLPYDATQYNTRYGDDTDANKYKHKGMLTGTLTALLDGSGKYLYTAMYYDNRGRLIQSHSTSHLAGGIEKEYVAYNFTGQPTKKKHIHTATGKTTQTEDYAYNYDHAGRLTKTTHKLNGGTEMVLAENTYDELGRLKEKKINNSNSLRSIYTYNVRSWLKSIAAGTFYENLYYNEDYKDNNNSVNNKKSYTGNISAMSWSTYDNKNRNYFYRYDGLSRLTAADYTEARYDNSEPSAGRYSANYQYDKHGNMTGLQRRGLQSNNFWSEVDILSYEYSGNQLKRITDSSGSVLIAGSEDFKDHSNAATEYFFNKNGAMTRDLNKGISDIKYNSLNLPSQMDIKSPTGEGRNLYTYSASGVKLKVKHTYNPNFSTAPVIGSDVTLSLLTQVKETDYVGNKIYENGKLKRILVDGGYWEDGKYYFFRQDHLGNTRVVQDQDGTLIQRKYYYPFGAGFPENTKDNGKQPYKYNGKELDQMHRLDWYDYSARHYDPALGRFTTVDPLAEKYYSISPYVYCANNPIKFIDKDGRSYDFPPIGGNPADYQRMARSQNIANTIKDNSSTIQKNAAVGLVTMSDVNDATVLATAITRGGNAINIDGTPASGVDIGFAVAGAFLPVVSGSSVKAAGKAIGEALGIGGDVAKTIERLKPEAKYLGSKKHGINWKEGKAMAKESNIPQGQWGNKSDLEFAGEKAATLKSGEGAYFDLPDGSKSIVHMPDGTEKVATKVWVRNNGTGTFHGYPLE